MQNKNIFPKCICIRAAAAAQRWWRMRRGYRGSSLKSIRDDINNALCRSQNACDRATIYAHALAGWFASGDLNLPIDRARALAVRLRLRPDWLYDIEQQNTKAIAMTLHMHMQISPAHAAAAAAATESCLLTYKVACNVRSIQFDSIKLQTEFGEKLTDGQRTRTHHSPTSGPPHGEHTHPIRPWQTI